MTQLQSNQIKLYGLRWNVRGIIQDLNTLIHRKISAHFQAHLHYATTRARTWRINIQQFDERLRWKLWTARAIYGKDAVN